MAVREELLRAGATPAEREGEAEEETTLRPRRLAEFVGQPALREHLEIVLGAARQRGQAADPPRTGLVTGPLRDRFGFVARLDYYDAGDLEAIVIRAARILGVSLQPEGAVEIAARSRGTPRIANRLLRRVRDFAEVRADGVVTGDVARDALRLFEVDER